MINKSISLLPLRDIVVFPGMVAPLFVGRKQSVNALNHVMNSDKKIFLVTQINSEVENPNFENLYKVGTVAKVLQLLKLPDGTIKVLVEGLHRAKIKNFTSNKDFIIANINNLEKKTFSTTKIKALVKIVIEQFEEYIKVNKKLSSELLTNLKSNSDPNKIADLISINLNIPLEKKQELLELVDLEKRLDKIYSYLLTEIDSFQVEKKIKGRVKRQMEKTQKEYYLNEQMKAIQRELGENDDGDEISEIEKTIDKINLSTEAKDKCKSELKKLKNMSPMSAEATVIRNYIDWILSLPWKNNTEISKNIKKAKKILEVSLWAREYKR